MRTYSFSLRFALVGVTVFAVILSAVLERSRRIRTAAAYLRANDCQLSFQSILIKGEIRVIDCSGPFCGAFDRPRWLVIRTDCRMQELPKVLETTSNMRSIDEIAVFHAKFDDEHAKRLAAIPSLREVSIHSSSITEVGAISLLTSPRISCLDFQGCRGIKSTRLHLLHIAPGITEVNFHNTGVDAAAIDALVRNNPNCKIKSEWAAWCR